MSISKQEQRVLHVLAQGGLIRSERNEHAKIIRVMCVTREGYILSDCNLTVFQRLRKRRLIQSRNGGPYLISRLGRLSVRAQEDNR